MIDEKPTKKSFWSSISNSIAFILSGIAIIITFLIGIAGGGSSDEDKDEDDF
ncbi:MAG: hypothetical protein NZ519_12870 [Bacteroidia bacterium]|nr:hypothetical protein [Bacteroidia bacterium]MDW8302670.1 hypothetical protein [Bacteroidia bacterium]